MAQFKLKATTDDRSGAIIQSFQSKWHEPLRNNEVSVVFRKVGPTAFTPTFMYVYIGSPISAIVARFEVKSYQTMTISEALRLVEGSLLSEDDLIDYAGTNTTLAVYKLQQLALAESPISRQEMFDKYDFWATPMYIPITNDGKTTLDSLGRFAESAH